MAADYFEKCFLQSKLNKDYLIFQDWPINGGVNNNDQPSEHNLFLTG